MSPPDRLLHHLEATGKIELLLPDERDLLGSGPVRDLPIEEQWAYLAANRRVAFWFTVVVACLRLLILGGGAVAALFFAADRLAHTLEPPLLLLVLVAAVALAWTARKTFGVRRELATLGRRLPPFETLGVSSGEDE